MSSHKEYLVSLVAYSNFMWKLRNDETGEIHFMPAGSIGAPASICKVGDTGTLQYRTTATSGYFAFIPGAEEK